MTLRVSHIQRFCVHDGPGIRTTVFLQGCPLRCWWCHNPETQASTAAHTRKWDVAELARHLMRDARWWRGSGGGVTLSGGEPLLQALPAADLLQRLGREGVHRVIETAGAAPGPAVELLLPHVDLWLFDVKSAEAQRFRAGTGGVLDVVLVNLRRVVDRGAAVRVRVPVISGFNDGAEQLQRIGEILAGLGRAVPVELLAGHEVSKSSGRAMPCSPQATGEQMTIARQAFDQFGVEVL